MGRRAQYVAALLALGACASYLWIRLDRDVIGPQPTRGYNTDWPDYSRPPDPKAPVIVVPEFSFAAPTAVGELPAFKTSPDQLLAAEGSLAFANPRFDACYVRLRLKQIAEDGKPRSKGTTQAVARGEQGNLTYRVQFRAPSHPGTYRIVLDALHFQLDFDADRGDTPEFTTTPLYTGTLLIE